MFLDQEMLNQMKIKATPRDYECIIQAALYNSQSRDRDIALCDIIDTLLNESLPHYEPDGWNYTIALNTLPYISPGIRFLTLGGIAGTFAKSACRGNEQLKKRIDFLLSTGMSSAHDDLLLQLPKIIEGKLSFLSAEHDAFFVANMLVIFHQDELENLLKNLSAHYLSVEDYKHSAITMSLYNDLTRER